MFGARFSRWMSKFCLAEKQECAPLVENEEIINKPIMGGRNCEFDSNYDLLLARKDDDDDGVVANWIILYWVD